MNKLKPTPSPPTKFEPWRRVKSAPEPPERRPGADTGYRRTALIGEVPRVHTMLRGRWVRNVFQRGFTPPPVLPRALPTVTSQPDTFWGAFSSL